MYFIKQYKRTSLGHEQVRVKHKVLHLEISLEFTY